MQSSKARKRERKREREQQQQQQQHKAASCPETQSTVVTTEQSTSKKRKVVEGESPWNFEVEYNDHFETPKIAYTDLLPVLQQVAKDNKKTLAEVCNKYVN